MSLKTCLTRRQRKVKKMPTVRGNPHLDSTVDLRLKGTIRPDWICMRVVPLDRHWKGYQHYEFLISYFWSWIFDKSSKFWAASCKNESTFLLVWITVCMCSNRDLFRRTVLQKCGRDINCSLDYSSCQHPAIQTKIEQHFGGLFHQIKVPQPIGGQDSMQTVIRTSRRLESFLHERLRTLKSAQIFKSEIKISKSYRGWCPFQGLSDGTTLM